MKINYLIGVRIEDMIQNADQHLLYIYISRYLCI